MTVFIVGQEHLYQEEVKSTCYPVIFLVSFESAPSYTFHNFVCLLVPIPIRSHGKQTF